MRVRIHRGTKEIGGNCIELESEGKHLLLDLGMPLTTAAPDEVELPKVAGLKDGIDPNFLGIVISHPHQDHYGLLPKVHPTTPIFIGKEAHAILEASAPFAPSGLYLNCVTHYRDRVPFDIGPFRITPFLNDHSAFDAYSLAVKAGGKLLFYSGDFRAHGRKGGAFERLLAQGPKGADVFLNDILAQLEVIAAEKGRGVEDSLQELIIWAVPEWFTGEKTTDADYDAAFGKPNVPS